MVFVPLFLQSWCHDVNTVLIMMPADDFVLFMLFICM